MHHYYGKWVMKLRQDAIFNNLVKEYTYINKEENIKKAFNYFRE